MESEPAKLCLEINIHEKAWSPSSLGLQSRLLLLGEGSERFILAVRNVSRLLAGLEDKVMKTSTSDPH